MNCVPSCLPDDYKTEVLVKPRDVDFLTRSELAAIDDFAVQWHNIKLTEIQVGDLVKYCPKFLLLQGAHRLAVRC